MIEDALAGITARPALEEWIHTERWASAFSVASTMRARDYANTATIRDVEWIEIGDAGEIIISAEVQGSRKRAYQVSIELSVSRSQWMAECECSCPVGSDCKHAAALLILLRLELSKGTARQSAAPATAALDQGVAAWLKQLEAAAPAKIPEPAPAKKPGSVERFLAYCIEVPSSRYARGLHLALRVASRLKDGTVRIQSGLAAADVSKPPQYMNREDLMLVTLVRQRMRKAAAWGTVTVEGGGWDELFEGMLATGRLYFGMEEADVFGSSDYQLLSAGPAEKVEAVWEPLPDGGARPEIRGLRRGLIVMPTEPARYVDPMASVVGVLESNLPPGMLPAWLRGPDVKPEQIDEVASRLSGVAAVVPVPFALETETRPALHPAPYLRVRSHAIVTPWERIDIIVGEIGFVYGDSPRLYPLSNSAPRQYVGVIEGRRVIWPRSYQAERAFESRLLALPLQRALEVFASSLLDSSTRHAMVAARPFPTADLAWFEMLESPGFDELRKEGWTIEVDPALGLQSQVVSSFEPAMEIESDHGVDWFRFDVSYEVDGKRFSLIPLIAEAIARNYPPSDSPDLPEYLSIRCENPEDGFIRFPAKQLMEMVERVRHLFLGNPSGPKRLDRLAAAGLADTLEMDSSETIRSLARLGRNLRDIGGLPETEIPAGVKASLRPYQLEGFRWLQFLAMQGLHGILADDMGLGKTLQTLSHLAAEVEKKPGKPSLVIAPTSVVPNWAAEAGRFVPGLKILTLQGADRSSRFAEIPEADLVFTSYPLLVRDLDELSKQEWHVLALDEAQHIKNPKSVTAHGACQLKAAHRLCLSGTPMENHLGELWSLMRFLMPGYLADEKTFNTRLRKPIERDRSRDAQLALNRRVSPLILRRTKDQVATELPEKTEIIHGIDLNKKQADLYESVRASMDKRVREAIEVQGLARSQIVVLDALLKLRQICCHPDLLKTVTKGTPVDSAKLDYLTEDLLPTLLEEGRRILLFSQFTSMLALIEEHLIKEKVPYLKLTGATKNRAALVKDFQEGAIPVFLISLKAGGTGLNLTAADTVIHYDPWWNPAAENQATDRAHRIGQVKPVFVHKLVCRGTIEDRILELQSHKASLVQALLSEETSALKLDEQTLSHLLAPLGT